MTAAESDLDRDGAEPSGVASGVDDDAGAPTAPEWQPLPWARAAVLVVVTRVALLGVASAAGWFFASTTGPAQGAGFEIWVRWDARAFLRMAEVGYDDPTWAAWFPLYPAAVAAVRALGVPTLIAGLLVPAAASVVAAAALWRLAEEHTGDPAAGRRAALYLLLFPTAVFLVAPYTEALFLAGTIPAFLEARRGRWVRVAAPAALAAGTRTVGIFVLAGLGVAWLQQRPWRDRRLAVDGAFALVVGTLPILAYLLFLTRRFGDPFYFVTAQSRGWGRSYVGPVRSFLNTWQTYHDGNPTNWVLVWRLEIVAAVVGLALLAVLLRRREWAWAVYVAGPMALLVTSTWYYSIPRMLLVLFPLPVLLAGWTARRPGRHDLLLAVFAILASFGAVAFTREAWVS